MSGDEGFPREVPGDIRESVSNPTELDNLLPGSSQSDLLPGATADRERINRLLDEAGEEAGDVAGDVAANVVRSLSDVGRDYEYLRSDMVGGAANLLDDAASGALRLQTGLMQQPINLLNDAYGIRASLGYDVPTMDVVNYSNATGNYEATIRGDLVPTKPGEGFEKPGYPTKPIDGTGDDTGVDEPPITEPPEPPVTQPPPVTTPPIQPPPTQPPPTQPPPVQPPPETPPTEPPPSDDDFPDEIPPKPTGELCDVPGPPDTFPNYAAGGQLVCPPGYELIWDALGIPSCVKIKCAVAPPPDEPPPIELPPDDINTPYDDEPPPTGPPPVMIDPDTCLYPPSPTVKLECGSAPPPPPKPAPFWLVVGCDGCGWKWCIWQGTEPPPLEEGERLHGPFDSKPNPDSYLQGICKIVTDDDEDKEDEEEEEEEKPEEEGGETDEEEEEEEEEPNGEDKPEGPKPEDRPQPRPDQYCNFIGGVQGAMGDIVPSFDVAIGFDKPDTLLGRLTQAVFRNNIIWLASFLPNTTASLIKWARRNIEFAVSSLACDRAKMAPMAITLGAMNVIQRWFGFIPHQTINTLKQASNSICQSEIPGAKETDAAYLRGDIDKATWECWHKANGNYLETARKVMESQRAKLDPTQIDWLFRRKYITRPQFDKLMREAGVIFEEDKTNIHNFNDAWPTQSDIVRFMQRDVADEVNVDWREVDQEFGVKFQGRVKEYADAAGIKRERMLDNWRAHFHIPSFTMGQRFFWRQRPGKDGVAKPFDRAAFRRMLIQDDWHPAFVDYMMDTAYLPVTISDATRAYMIYAIKEDVLRSVFMDNGRDERAAQIMVDYWKRRREVNDRRTGGYPTLRRLAGQYARCEITESQYRDTVARIVLSEEQEKAAIDAAVLSRDVRMREQSIKAVRRPYILGILDDGEANQGLAEAGVDPSCISAMIDNWKLERLRRDKYLTADQLCGMRERGIIGPQQQLLALVRSGWNRDDAMLIVQNCGAILSEKAARKADTMARRAAADARRVQKEMERLRRLQECGPPPCPTRRGVNSQSSGATPQASGPGATDTGSTTR